MTTLTSREILKRRIELRDLPRIGWHFDVMPAQGQVWLVTDSGFARYAPDPGAVCYPQVCGKTFFRINIRRACSNWR
jgi:hypothetical protein